MKFFKFILIFLFLIGFNIKLFSITNSYMVEEKDPFIAGLLSVSMMGLGQFYAKEYTKGSLFVLADFIQKGSLILLIVNFNDKYTNKDNGDNVVKWSELTTPDKILIIGYLTFYFGTQVYCVVDAMKSAENYNRSIKKMRESKFNIGFSLNKDNPILALNYRSRF